MGTMHDSSLLKPKLIFGTGASSAKDSNELYRLVKTCIKNNIIAFDTAPSYRTEKVLGDVLKRCIAENLIRRDALFIQSKIDGWQMQEGQIETYVRNVLNDMHLDYLDSLLVHWPFLEYIDDTWKKMQRLQAEGYVKQLGICNLRSRNMIDLKYRDIIPEIVQIERNPLNIMEKEVSYCLNEDIWVQAYSPLCKMDERIRDSVLLKQIAEKYYKNVGQVVLRWQIDTGVTPIFTSKKISRVEEYASVSDFTLSKKEIDDISAMNQNYKLYLESFQCPGM